MLKKLILAATTALFLLTATQVVEAQVPGQRSIKVGVLTGTDGGGDPDPPDPPTGAPTLRAAGVHPRMFVIPAGAAGFGVPLDTLRTRLQTATYFDDFAAYIEDVDGTSVTTTGKTKIETCIDGWSFAFLAMIDPLNNGFKSAQAASVYAAAAKTHAARVAAQTEAGTWFDNNDAEYLLSHPSVHMTMALIYDWTMAAGTSWTEQEKRDLIEASLFQFGDPGTIGGGNAFIFGSQFTTHFLGVLSYAMVGDHPSGTTTVYPHDHDGDKSTTITYQEALEEILYAEMIDLWLDDDLNSYYSGIEANLDAVASDSDGNQMPGHFEGNSYMQAFSTHITMGALLVSSVHTDLDLYERNDYFSKWAHYGIAVTRPVSWGLSGTVEITPVIRFGVAGTSVDFNQNQARYGVWYGSPAGAAYKTTPNTTLARVARWMRENRDLDWGDGGNDNPDTRKAYQTFYKYIFGTTHLGSALSPADAGLSTSTEFAGGLFILRTGYDTVDDTLVTFSAPETVVAGGHWKSNLSTFRLEKYGNLIVQGGARKSSAPGLVGWQSQSPMDYGGMISVYDSSEQTNTTDRRFGKFGGHWFDDTDPGASGANLCAPELYGQANGLRKTSDTQPNSRYYCNTGNVQAKHMASLAQALTGYDYVKYDFSSAWKRASDNITPTKVSKSVKYFVYQRGAENHEYIIEASYLRKVNQNFPAGYSIKVVDDATTTDSWTPVELGDDYHRRQGGHWTSGLGTFQVNNNFLVKGYQQQGVLFWRPLGPTDATIHKCGGDYYEARDVTTSTGCGEVYDMPDHASFEIASIASGCSGTCTIVTVDGTSNHQISSDYEVDDEGPYILIQGTGNAILDAEHLATYLTRTTFSIPVTFSIVSGTDVSNAIGYRSLDSDAGADAFGAYRLTVVPGGSPATDHIFFNVYQWGCGAAVAANCTSGQNLTSMATTTRIVGDGGDDLMAAQIEDSTQKQLHVFPSTYDGSIMTCLAGGTCSITPTTTGSIRVRIYGLAASTTYYYSAGSTILFDTADGGSWTSTTSSAAGVVEFTYTR
jgi:hypothetical protein